MLKEIDIAIQEMSVEISIGVLNGIARVMKNDLCNMYSDPNYHKILRSSIPWGYFGGIKKLVTFDKDVQLYLQKAMKFGMQWNETSSFRPFTF